MALMQAEIAFEKGEVPVGAVVVKNGEVVSIAHNLRETNNNAVAHAEVLAIQKACDVLGKWRLDECDIYVTLEPCLMCTGAIINSRIKSVYFGSFDRYEGAFETGLDCRKLNSTLTIYSGIMEDECNNILQKFFTGIRK